MLVGLEDTWLNSKNGGENDACGLPGVCQRVKCRRHDIEQTHRLARVEYFFELKVIIYIYIYSLIEKSERVI